MIIKTKNHFRYIDTIDVNSNQNLDLQMVENLPMFTPTWNYQYTVDSTITSVKDIADNTPENFNLEQNYPNPFNPSTSISFSLPFSTHICLSIFNILGQEVATLLEGTRLAGNYSINWSPGNNPSGVYYSRLTTGDFTAVKKMVLVK